MALMGFIEVKLTSTAGYYQNKTKQKPKKTTVYMRIDQV